MKASSPGVIFLVHRGAAFIDDLLTLAEQLHLEAYVLTSAPPVNPSERLATLRERSTWLRDSPRESLTRQEVLEAIDTLRREQRHVLACLTVWEGYRQYMAEANALLGAPDESQATLSRLLDKHVLRSILREHQLSRVESEVVTPEVLERLSREGAKKFIKPRRGLASFGAFTYRPDLTWDTLLKLRQEMATDLDFRDTFDEAKDFVAEDYIEGTEHSFEVIVCGGEPHVIGIHEKVALNEQHGATLEVACVSPSVSISEEAIQQGEAFIRRCLRVLGVTTGCYHIEARFDGERWEIIEINPRIGGSFINQSVRVTTDGECLLDLWLRTLLARDAEARESLQAQLATKSLLSVRGRERVHGSFFRVYFGEPGRRIAEVTSQPMEPAAELMRVLVPVGTLLPTSSRELFVAQMMWRMKRSSMETELATLQKLSAHALEIRYE